MSLSNFINSFSISKHDPIFQNQKLGWMKYLLVLLGFCLALLVLKFKFYAVALVVGLVGGGCLLFNPEAALLVNVNVSQLYVQLTTETLLPLILSWILFMVNRKPKLFISFQSKLLFFLGIWVLLIAPFNSSGFLHGLRYSLRLLLPIGLFYMITTIIRTEKQLLRFILALIISGLGLSILGNIQLFFQVPIFPNVKTDPHSIILPLGPFGDPVAYGAQLTFILALCFSRLLGEPKGKIKKYFLFVLLAMIFSLFASLNRSAILGFGIFTILMLLFNWRGGLKLIIFIIIGLIILFQVGINELFVKKIETIATETHLKVGHFGDRLETSFAGLRLLRENPEYFIFGGGLNSYHNLIHPYLHSSGAIRHSTNTNAFIFFLVEMGIFGYLLLLWVIGLTLKDLYRMQKKFSESDDYVNSFISQGLFASLITLLFISLVNTIWDMNLFWFNLSLPVVMKEIWKVKNKGIQA